MLLTVLMPDQTQPQLSVADTDLVFDGLNFVTPSAAKYVVLYSLPVDALSLPFDDIEYQVLVASVRISALVLDRYAYTGLPTSPELEAAPVPEGECLCFVTCSGTKLSFVKVYATS